MLLYISEHAVGKMGLSSNYVSIIVFESSKTKIFIKAIIFQENHITL